MTEEVVNLPRIMRDALLKCPIGNSCDVFYEVWEQDMFCPYGDWKGEQPKVRRGRVIPPLRPPQVQQEEQ
ncbi:hypothetical protein PIB30_096224, partial [Stylosanthes scabra]|nr:hypothetical protein [Stylosanthes scabra]